MMVSCTVGLPVKQVSRSVSCFSLTNTKIQFTTRYNVYVGVWRHVRRICSFSQRRNTHLVYVQRLLANPQHLIATAHACTHPVFRVIS